MRQLYCNQQCFGKKICLKNFATFTGKHFFIKLQAQRRYFLVNNMKLSRTPILKNINEPFTFALFKLTLWNSCKETILKTRWQKLINKYENTFIWTLHTAMKRNHWNMSLNLYYRHVQSNSYWWVLNLKSIPVNLISFLNM